MKPSLWKVVVVLGLMLIFLATGCQSVKKADVPDGLTIETLANVNTTDNILKKYKSVRVESTFYAPSEDDGEWESYQETTVYVNGDNGIGVYTILADGFESAVFKDTAYFKFPDGMYGVYACIDDGCYEQFYAPAIAKGLIYTPLKDEKIISNTVEDGVRKMVVQAGLEGSYAAYVGVTQGVIETTYELDLESGLVLRASEYILDGDKKQILAEGSIVYGEDDAFTEPEYVQLCRDMSETRTVHLVLDAGTPDEKTFTYTFAKKARLLPETESDYELFTDPAYTIPYEGPPSGEYPDEATIYVRKF